MFTLENRTSKLVKKKKEENRTSARVFVFIVLKINIYQF